MRPQPTRAPRGEVMALSHTRGGGELAWAVAGGTAAAALWLPLAPSVAGNVPRPPPPPPGGSSVHGSGRQRMPPNRGATGVGCAAPGGDGKPTPADASAQARRVRRHHHHNQPWVQPAGCQGAGSGRRVLCFSIGGPPPRMGSGTGPSMRQEGVYTPTAHEGAPR